MPTPTPANPLATDEKKLTSDETEPTGVEALEKKLHEVIKALEFDYPILR